MFSLRENYAELDIIAESNFKWSSHILCSCWVAGGSLLQDYGHALLMSEEVW